MLTADQLNALSEQVIGAAIAVHRALGQGLIESAYEACLEF
jgi:GxxExxY protein